MKPVSEMAHSTSEFAIVAKFGDHVLHCLTSSFLNVIREAGRQVGRQTKISNTFFRIQYFGIWLRLKGYIGL